MELKLALAVLASLVGLPALWSVIIDLLKFVGVVTDGTAGKWNAAFGLVSLIMILVAVNFFPNLDIGGVDKLLAEIAQFVGILLSFLTQIFVAKGTHALTSRIVPAFSFSQRK